MTNEIDLLDPEEVRELLENLLGEEAENAELEEFEEEDADCVLQEVKFGTNLLPLTEEDFEGDADAAQVMANKINEIIAYLKE